MPKLSIRDIDLAHKHVFIRVDFNVPLSDDGQIITDDTSTMYAIAVPTSAEPTTLLVAASFGSAPADCIGACLRAGHHSTAVIVSCFMFSRHPTRCGHFFPPKDDRGALSRRGAVTALSGSGFDAQTSSPGPSTRRARGSPTLTRSRSTTRFGPRSQRNSPSSYRRTAKCRPRAVRSSRSRPTPRC